MISEVAQKMENILSSGHLSISSEMADEISQAELNAYLTGVFKNESSEQYFSIRDFYERLAVLLVEARDFDALAHKFTLLSQLYNHPFSKTHPSLYEAKLTSLHLLYLYTGKNQEDFQIRLASIAPLILNSAEVKTIIEFTQLIDLGNYQRAFDLIHTLSPSHNVLLSRLIDRRRYQTCKMVEYSYPGLQVADLAKILELKSESDFDNAVSMINTLYEKGEINWQVRNKNQIQKRKQSGMNFNDEKIIKDTIGLIRDFEKII